MDGIWLKRSWGGTVENVSILVAVGVNKEGYREMLGAAEGSREDAESWKHFCRYLKERGFRSVKLIISLPQCQVMSSFLFIILTLNYFYLMMYIQHKEGRHGQKNR